MSDKIAIDLKSVQETLLLPLWGRAVETTKPNPRLVDKTAAEIVGKIDYDFSTIAANINPLTRFAWIARCIHFDRTIRHFLEKHPNATVVNIGCGLDTTFERIDNGNLLWYDLDLPDVIRLREKFISQSDRRRFIASSFLDDGWTHELSVADNVFFLAAGVFYYFEAAQMREFFSKIAGRFPGSEAVFDAATPLGVRLSNKVVLKAGGMDDNATLKWGLKNASEIRDWDNRIVVLEEYPMYTYMKKGLSLKGRIATLTSDLLRVMSIIHLGFSK
jgi:O-methyltransferase involved in polyketide biosynthesis